MRVTQSMLSNNMLRNLNTSYSKMGVWQQQLSSGSKLLRPSDDPVGVTKAMSYRTQLAQNAQYDENLDTATKWLDTTDTALGSVGSAMQRVQELITQAANDTNQTVDRQQMLKEIEQIYEQIKDIGNTKIGDTYIFSGTRTNQPLYGNSVKIDQVLYRDANSNIVADVQTTTQTDGTSVSIVRDAAGNVASKITNAKDANGNMITTITDGNNNVIQPPATGKYIDGSGNIIETAQDGTVDVTHAKDSSNTSSVDYKTTRTTTTTTYGAVATEKRVENADGTSVTSILDKDNKVVAKISITKDGAGNPVTTVTDGAGDPITNRLLAVDNAGGVIEVYADGTKKIGTLEPTIISPNSTTSGNVTTSLDTYRSQTTGKTIATVSKQTPSTADGTFTTSVRDSTGSLVATITGQKDSFGAIVVTVKDANNQPIQEPANVLRASDGHGNIIEVDALGNVGVKALKPETSSVSVPEPPANVSVNEFTFKNASGYTVAISETVIDNLTETYTTTVRDGIGNLVSTTTGPSPISITDYRNLPATNGVAVESNGSIIKTDPTTGVTTVTSSKDNLSTTHTTTMSGTQMTGTTEYKNSVGDLIATAVKTTNTATDESVTVFTDKDGNTVSTTEVTKDQAGRNVITVTDAAGNTVIAPDKLSVQDADGNYIITNPLTGETSVSTTISAIEGPVTSLNTANDKRIQTLSGMNAAVNIEIYNDIKLQVNTTDAQKMFEKMDTVFAKVFAALKGTAGTTSGKEIGDLLGGTNSAADRDFTTIQGVQDLFSMQRSTVGAKQNRVDMMSDRLAIQKEVLTKQQSNVEDVEYEEAITNMITQESIHRAALSVGGRIIQQTLVDFIR